MNNMAKDVPGRRMIVTRALPAALMDRIGSSFTAWTNPDDRTLTGAELLDAAKGWKPDIMLVMAMDRIDADCIGALPPSVRAIATLSVGHDHIDLEAARRSLSERFGSADAYLEQALGVDATMREALKAQLVDA